MSTTVIPACVNRWPGIAAAARARQWSWIVDLAERVAAAPELAGLLLLGSFARGEFDSLSDVDFMVVVEADRFDDAWRKRHRLHPDDAICWDYPKPHDRDVAAHRWLTANLVLFDGLITTTSGARVADPLAVVVGEGDLLDRMTRFDPAAGSGPAIELHAVEQLYGQLKLAARAARRV